MHAASEVKPIEGARRLPGYRVVLAVFAVGGAVAALVILMGVLMGGSADEDLICRPDPAACATVRDYAQAFNSGDSARVQALFTERGMQRLLSSDSSAQLRARLDALTDNQRLEDFRVTTLSAGEDEAFVNVRFVSDGYEFEAKYRLVLQDGRWLIDG